MAVSVAQYAQTASWFTADAGSPKTITGVAWSAGDIIVVKAGTEQAVMTVNTPTNANLTFALQASSTGGGSGECAIWIWTATAASSQSGQTISLTSNNASLQWGASAKVWTGASGTANATANLTESNISRTVSAGSGVDYMLEDFNATNPPGKTPATGSGSANERLDQGNTTNHGQYDCEWVGTSAGTFSFGPNNYTSLQVAQAVIEVLSAAAVPVTVTAAGTLNSATSTATLAGDVGTAFAVGDVIVACISADNNGTNGVTSLTTVTDAGGNVYEVLQATYDPGAAAAGQTVGIAWARITTALLTTDDITINFSPNTVSKAAVIWRLRPDSGITLQKVTSGFGAGSATASPTITTSSITIGDVVVAALAVESNAAVTADADSTNGAWSTQSTATGTTGTVATSSRVASQTKIVTATATQTYNPTLTSADCIDGWITFTPAFIRPNVQVRPSVAVHQSFNW